MKFLDDNGEIVEGIPLTEADVEILADIIEMMRAECSEYISTRSANKIGRSLIVDYIITRRPEPTLAEVMDLQWDLKSE